mmetsp:Transcript_23809/g.76525  ORF Transcript_23809/g.76525 Transcript_23809/m.76525 type:complete len:242 (-) Transcript_23809:21-746(-)
MSQGRLPDRRRRVPHADQRRQTLRLRRLGRRHPLLRRLPGNHLHEPHRPPLGLRRQPRQRLQRHPLLLLDRRRRPMRHRRGTQRVQRLPPTQALLLGPNRLPLPRRNRRRRRRRPAILRRLRPTLQLRRTHRHAGALHHRHAIESPDDLRTDHADAHFTTYMTWTNEQPGARPSSSTHSKIEKKVAQKLPTECLPPSLQAFSCCDRASISRTTQEGRRHSLTNLLAQLFSYYLELLFSLKI